MLRGRLMRQIQQEITSTYHRRIVRHYVQSHRKTMAKENDMLRNTGVRQMQQERTSTYHRRFVRHYTQSHAVAKKWYAARNSSQTDKARENVHIPQENGARLRLVTRNDKRNWYATMNADQTDTRRGDIHIPQESHARQWPVTQKQG